jgi:hypothetical protein
MTSTPPAPSNAVLERLRGEQPLYAVELRPPKSDLPAERSMDTWIDMYHSVRRLAQHDTLIFLTDNAVGEAEEENLRHLVTNLAGDVSTSALVPFLTCKHALEYCTMYADRAVGYGFPALTVLGGDRTVGPPRCVEYAYLLRQHLRVRHPHLLLGGWANPHADPVQQVDYLAREAFTAEFYLTQIVSHHQLEAVERFLNEATRRGIRYPGVFGVFLYRSGNPRTLGKLAEFFPVPVDGVKRDFAQGMTAEAICATTIRGLRDLGVTKVYVSNLGYSRPEARYRRLLEELSD